jgi:tetratricopeptide (TPR) repeat protein
MDALLAWLAALGDWLAALGEQYPWLAPVSAIVTIIGTAAAAVLGLYRRIVGKAYRIRREVEEKNERLEANVAALRSDIKLLKQRLPEAAWQLAEHERKDDNEESAIRVLRHYMEIEGTRLSEMARQISRFHLGLVTEQDRDRHLVPAERFALLAFHLDPRHGEAGELLKEIQQLRGERPFEHVQFTDDVSMPEDDSVGYYRLPRTSEAVASLLADAETAIVRGHYRHGHALADVAYLSARRWTLGDREPLALTARYWCAAALQRLGRYDQARAEIDGTDQRPGILSLLEQHPDLGPTHPSTLNTRWLRADIFDSLGRYDQALLEIDGTDQRPSILSLGGQSPDLGPTHPHTLSTRWLRANILGHLGRYDQALLEIDGTDQRPGILSLREQRLGPTHPDTLVTRWLRAEILHSLSHYDQALAEIEGTEERPGILSLVEQSRDLGPTHPFFTLPTRDLRALILESLGHYDEALAEIDGTDERPGILRLLEQVPYRGPTHPGTLGTRSLRGAILYGLGRYEESERELRSVGAEQEEALGPAHASNRTAAASTSWDRPASGDGSCHQRNASGARRPMRRK